MKTTFLLITLMLNVIFSFAQIDPSTPWTWMKGDNTIDQAGVYGTQGVASSTNKPGARNFSTTWRCNNGNLWLFGGAGFSATNSGYLNDLWKYDPYTNKWTWVKGDKTINQYSVYGTKGTPNSSNKPGANYSGISWTDANNNLWLFGGFGYNNTTLGFLNALWKYNPATNQWTWVNGDKTINQVGVYGTQGIENATNKPGARYGSRTWVDAAGYLWLFGGYGYNGTTSGILNDIWKYNPNTNQWTWVKGDNAVEQKANYGIKAVANTTNQPGARYVSTSWTDVNDNFWLFGGYGYDESTSGILNDIWKYNPLSNEWTWISGDKLVDQTGIYGTQGVPNSSNKPGGRYVSNSWTDAEGKLWLFGGYGYDGNNQGYLNDLWNYNPDDDTWTWIKGDNTVDHVGIYGTQGMPSSSNKSGARNGSVSWTDGNGNLWLFGGNGFDGSTSGILNDLWKISNLLVPLPIHLLNFSGVLNNEVVHLKWEAVDENNFSHYNIQRSIDGINFVTIGLVTGAGNSSRNVYSFPDYELQNVKGTSVFYRLQLVDTDTRFTFSKILKFDLKELSPGLSLFPNPAIQSLNLSFTQPQTGKVNINIFGINGKLIRNLTETIQAGRASLSIDVNSLPSGSYLLTIINRGGIEKEQFIKHY